MHHLLGVALAIAMVVCAALPAQAAKKASLVIDANTGRTLHAAAADARRYPASLTKIMTLYLTFDAISKGRLSLSSRIRFSPHAAGQPPSKLGFSVGDTISVDDAIKALVVKSANDVAAALAEQIGGSEAAFARQMTQRARALGMRQTVFRNASGLPDSRQVTTARDMSRLALALQRDFPRFFQYFRLRRFTFRGRTYRNHNRLLGRFAGTDGIKTGYTRASGFNLVTNVRRGNRHIVGVVLGSKTSGRRNRRMQRLLAAALPKASPVKVNRRKPVLIARPKLIQRPAPRTAAVAHRRPSVRLPWQAQTTWSGKPGSVRTPSSLQQQARVLAGRSPASKRPITRSAAPGRQAGQRIDTHQIQVGAFFSEREAHRHLAVVRSRAGELLAGFEPVSLKVSGPNRAIFRARFTGFDARAASTTCAKLKAARIDCFVSTAN